MAHIFVSSAHKSSGKTMTSVGLAAACTARGLRVQAFKKGPDYIDPMWLTRASKRPCYNLDYNTQTEAEIASFFSEHARGSDLALIEGNKGLHDGVDPEGRDSSAALAKLLGAPVILVINGLGITRGVAPLILGYQAFDRDVVIAGVILNQLASARHEEKLRQAIERYTGVPIIGAIGRNPALTIRERHLGLTTPNETAAVDELVNRLQRVVEEGVDVGRVLALARDAERIIVGSPASELQSTDEGAAADVRIGIARDTAFGFYYPDDIQALEKAGAKLVFFDTLREARLPDADGLLIGGGFPETQMSALAANKPLMMQICQAAERGLPIYAECGGLMYLTRSIAWNSERHEMVGFIPADTVMHATPQGRGLVVLEETEYSPWLGADRRATKPGPLRVPAHEFHYAALENLDPATRFGYRVVRGRGIDGQHDGIVKGNVLASFSHLRSTARSGNWARAFVCFVRACKLARARSKQAPLHARRTPYPASKCATA